MSSLENQLETAYAAVARANEPTLAEVPFRLATLLLAQAPAPGDDGQEDGVEQVPETYILITAKRGEELIVGKRVGPIDVTVTVGMNADAASVDGAMDALFTAATRPFLYATCGDYSRTPAVSATLCDALTNAASSLAVLGRERCTNGSELEFEGSQVKRSQTATFQCRDLSH